MAPLPRIDREQVLKSVNIVDIIGNYGIHLKKSGKEFEACCPFHKESTPSFKVNEKKQIATCFGCGWKGDAIRFVTDFENIPFPKAVRLITGQDTRQELHIEPMQRLSLKEDDEPEWTPIIPVPETAPEPNFIYRRKVDGEWREFQVATNHAYRDSAGNLIGYVVRLLHPVTGKKETLPRTYCVNKETGEACWRWCGFDRPRPLYGLDHLAQKPNAPVFVSEGEKCADVSNDILPMAACISWPGGTEGLKHADWSPLATRSVILWRDNDPEGYGTMYGKYTKEGEFIPGLVQILQSLGVTKIKVVEPPEGREKGWDIADAVQLENWSASDVLAYIKAHNQEPLPPLPYTEPLDQAQPQTFDNSMSDYAAAMMAMDEEQQDFYDPSDYVGGDAIHEQEQEPATETMHMKAHETSILKAGDPIRALGYNHGNYFYLCKGSRQVASLAASSHSKLSLIGLAPLDFWIGRFPKDADGNSASWDMAVNGIMRACEGQGVFSFDRLRGRGAWWDNEKAVLHLGDHLIVDGEVKSLDEPTGDYIYEAAAPMRVNTSNPLSSNESRVLIDICKQLRWEHPFHAYLLSGWIMIAPICGAMYWRPHIWLSGGAGTGKTWIMKHIISACAGQIASRPMSSTTEAGIRQNLGNDAIPVIFDEAEGADIPAQQRLQAIMELMRQASSETDGEIMKGSAGGKAMSFKIRSMFALASIGLSISQYADKTRISVLSLRSISEDEDQEENRRKFAALERQAAETITPDFVERLHARAISMIPVIRANAKTFAQAGAAIIGQQRLGDQIGAMLAGAYALHSNKVISLEEAEKWMNAQDWEEESSLTEQRDEFMLLRRILESFIKVMDNMGSTVDRSIGELIECATCSPECDPTIEKGKAGDALARHGVKVTADMQGIVIANAHIMIAKILRDSPWPQNWGKILKRLPGCISHDPVSFAGAGTQRGTYIPVATINNLE